MISIVASSNSQTIFPIKTKHQGENAIIISEAQMDTVNLLFLRYKKLNVASQRLNVDVERWKNEAYSLQLQSNFYKKSDSVKSKIIKNKNTEIAVLHELRIIDSLSKGKPKNFKNYLISFLLGGIAATAAFIVL